MGDAAMTSRRKRISLIAGAAAAAVLATIGAVNNQDVSAVTPSADSPLFEGLPKTTVVEVLNNPKAHTNISIWPAQETTGRNALWQGMVINFTQCRQMLTVYQEWKVTGVAPELPPLVLPVNPAGDVVRDAKIVDTSYREAIASGDPAQVSKLLQAESGCGAWVPARAGDTQGLVVADLVATDAPTA